MTHINRQIECRRIRWRIAGLKFQRALVLSFHSRKAYSPYQPRVPAGHPDGGQWARVAGPGWRGSGRGFGIPGATFGQNIRLERAIARTEDALSKIRQRDPSWRPTTQSLQSPGSIEGTIRRAEARAEEAEARLEQMRFGIGGNFGPSLESVPPRSPTSNVRAFDGAGWIDTYRSIHNSPDLFGRPTWPSDQGTVAVTRIDGRLVFGASSDTPVYEKIDRVAASEWRERLISGYPKVMRSDNIGYKPNDAIFHAEATVLIRAANENAGSLAGKTLEVHTDRDMCYTSCRKVLPFLGLELGNPTVTFVGRSGVRRTMLNGRWQE